MKLTGKEKSVMRLFGMVHTVPVSFVPDATITSLKNKGLIFVNKRGLLEATGKTVNATNS